MYLEQQVGGWVTLVYHVDWQSDFSNNFLKKVAHIHSFVSHFSIWREHISPWAYASSSLPISTV